MMRAVELPVLPSAPKCPAALTISGACMSQQGIVCRVMQRDHEDDPGLDMTAAATGFIHHEATGGVFLNLKSDPKTVERFCHGDAIPVLDDDDVAGGRSSYTYCPTWQAECHRLADGRDRLLEEPEPEPVAMGVVDEDSNPWAQARSDLEMFGVEA